MSEKKGQSEPEPTISIGLGEGFIELSMEEVRDLRVVARTPGWLVFRGILKSMRAGASNMLLDRGKDLEDLRFSQGQADACATLARIVEEEVPEWYDAQDKQEEGAEEDA